MNEVLERHFSGGVDPIDIDVEGLDFEILKEIDYPRFRPRVVCVEIHGGHYMKPNGRGGYANSVPADMFFDFMKGKGYRLLVPLVLNGIFVRD